MQKYIRPFTEVHYNGKQGEMSVQHGSEMDVDVPQTTVAASPVKLHVPNSPAIIPHTAYQHRISTPRLQFQGSYATNYQNSLPMNHNYNNQQQVKQSINQRQPSMQISVPIPASSEFTSTNIPVPRMKVPTIARSSLPRFQTRPQIVPRQNLPRFILPQVIRTGQPKVQLPQSPALKYIQVPQVTQTMTQTYPRVSVTNQDKPRPNQPQNESQQHVRNREIQTPAKFQGKPLPAVSSSIAPPVISERPSQPSIPRFTVSTPNLSMSAGKNNGSCFDSKIKSL